MTRIVAGRARGRRLAVPAGQGTRPTADRVREAIFSSVQSTFGAFAGLRVLDLYAGSGALGLEALSRGAGEVVLVESDPRAAATIRANIDAVGLDGVTLRPATVEQVLAGSLPDVFDLVLADPPYAMNVGELAGVLAQLAASWLARQALVVVERPTRGGALVWPAGLTAERDRRYGETTVWYGRPSPPTPSP